MSTNTKNLCRSALLAAVSFVFLWLASALPTMKLALMLIASLGAAVLCMSCSWKWALGAYAVTAALALLLLPTKSAALLYSAFFGFYPIWKLFAERQSRSVLRWGMKLALFNAALIVLTLFASSLLGLPRVEGAGLVILGLLGANAVFLVYDYALNICMLYYIRKIAGRWIK